MIATLVLTCLLGGSPAHGVAVNGNQYWQEEVHILKMPGLHPTLRFNPEWKITRLERSQTYMIAFPTFIQQGTFSVQGSHYSFHALMEFELEKADVLRLTPEMDAQTASKFKDDYIKATKDFEGDYNPSTGALTISYPIGRVMQSWDLYPYTVGDDQLPNNVGGDGLIGLWHAPCPFPERLDPYVRYKIGGVEGLQRFLKEAVESDKAEFKVINLRRDGNYRADGLIDQWVHDGSTVTLFNGPQRMTFTLSADGQKLMAGKNVAFQRN